MTLVYDLIRQRNTKQRNLIRSNNDLRPYFEKKNTVIKLPDCCIDESRDIENGCEKFQDYIISEKSVKLSERDKLDLVPKETLIDHVGNQLYAIPCNNSDLLCPRNYKDADQQYPISALELPFEKEKFSTDCCKKISVDLHEPRIQPLLLMPESVNSDAGDMEEQEFSNAETQVQISSEDIGSADHESELFVDVGSDFLEQEHSVLSKMRKAGLSYAAWCLTQARNSLSIRVSACQLSSLFSILDEKISAVRFQLNYDEKSKVKSIITDIYHKSQVAVESDQENKHSDYTSYPEYQVFLDSLVHETTCLMETAAGALGFESTYGECPSVVLSSESQIIFLGTFSDIEKSVLTSCIQEVIDIWWSLRRRRVSLLGHDSHGCFQFLSHSSLGLKESNRTNIPLEFAIGKAKGCTLRALLHILVILLNYGAELEETLNHGFATIPSSPWQESTPQLFAQLSSNPNKLSQPVKNYLSKEGLEKLLTQYFGYSGFRGKPLKAHEASLSGRDCFLSHANMGRKVHVLSNFPIHLRRRDNV